MEGLYLYCIRKKIDTPLSFSTLGIDGRHEVRTLTYQDLEAVVSKVSLEEFASEEIQKRAQGDLKWIKEKAIIHEKIIEEAMRKNEEILSVLPMKFGIIFKEKKALKETLNKHYEQFTATLEKLEGKQEWSIKVYLTDKKRFELVIKEKSEVIKEKEKEIASLPEGTAYFMEEELKEIISREMDKELKNIVEHLFESLGKQAVALIKSKILEKELIGRRELMVLNSAYLIPEEKIGNFKKEAEGLNQEIQTKGFYLEYSGPWPAYNFTSS